MATAFAAVAASSSKGAVVVPKSCVTVLWSLCVRRTVGVLRRRRDEARDGWHCKECSASRVVDGIASGLLRSLQVLSEMLPESAVYVSHQ